jgi:ppGpp synthetase/RelA/SpoT-type nucleotidyltranferase
LAVKLSKTQIDRLGDRLRKGSPTEADLRLLDDYRLSFGEAYDTVVRTVRDQFKLEPTGRPAKSTSSIIEKLNRETIRLSQMQDIAGCRVLVADVAEQDRVVASLRSVFPDASVVDRRANPSYGYRAVHVIAEISGKSIEIQVRSPLQHLWAEFSEALSDVVDPNIKYGRGNDKIRHMLTEVSVLVADFEQTEMMMARLQEQRVHEDRVEKLGQENVRIKEMIAQLLGKEISWLESQKGQKQ